MAKVAKKVGGGRVRTHRPWRQAGLQLPRRRPRRRIAGGRPRPLPPANANFVWAYDFVFDATAEGQQLKCLTVVDEFTHECLAIDVAGSIRSKRVIEVLSRLVSLHDAPLFPRSDNGPEFVSHAILEWIAQSGIGTALIDPGKPWRTVETRASTASSATSACHSNGSDRAPRRPLSSRLGGATTTLYGRIAALPT